MSIDQNSKLPAIVLAIDASSPILTLAVADDQELLAKAVSDSALPHSKSIFSLLEQVLRDASVTIDDVSLWATTTGPGSFTGLRVGLAAIKGLAQATGRPLIGTSTLEALARSVECRSAIVVSLINSPRGDVFRGLYQLMDDMRLRPIEPEAIDSIDSVITYLQSLKPNQPVIFVGQGALTYQEKIQTACEVEGGQFSFINDYKNIISGWNLMNRHIHLAPLMALQAHKLFAIHQYTEARPHYLRPSDAEIRA